MEQTMNRDEMKRRLNDSTFFWDFIIIGGGATGIGTAIEAASRGYQALLLEQSDFGAGTSSRSTKLVHGGVRYLQQGNISLVLEALKERAILRRNAPHLVHNLPFIIPNYDWWEGPFYGIGLKLYDILAGREGFGPSRYLTKERILKHIPTIERKGLRGGIIYYDGQFDDARLIINMAQTAVEQGTTLINYIKVTKLTKKKGLIYGVIAEDIESGKQYDLKTKVVINATGVFTDAIRSMDDPNRKRMIVPSQGTHIVLDKSFLPGDSAIMVPHTDDGRVLFAIPWHNRIIVGTTDTPVDTISINPVPLDEEISFLLTHSARYLTKDPSLDDIMSVFAGLRPLVSPQESLPSGKEEKNTASLSRDHCLHISNSGLVTITGGKWTTYRKMAEETIDQAAVLAQLEHKDSVTKELNIHGFHQNIEKFKDLKIYGSDAQAIQNLFHEHPSYQTKLHPRMDIYAGEVIWSVRHEMARTVEDFLSRHTRALILDARTSMEMASKVAEIMKEELKQDFNWQNDQIEKYNDLAKRYLPAGVS
jgi:glycerol-3-phosphate dehydrogenase